MLVDWTKNCLKIIPLTKQCKNALELGISKVQLHPGPNDIQDVIWAEIKEFVGISQEIKDGKIVELSKAKADAPITAIIEKKVKNIDKEGKQVTTTKKIKVSETPKITDMEANKAIELIQKCDNKVTLLKWQKEESRGEVRNYIKDQLDYIKNPSKKLEDNE